MNRASIFLGAGWVGLGGLLLAALAQIGVLPIIGFAPALAVAVIACFAMMATRKADEYTEGLWNAAASIAFAVMLLNLVALPFAEGSYDGLNGAERRQDVPAEIFPLLAVIGFYVALFIKRLLGNT